MEGYAVAIALRGTANGVTVGGTPGIDLTLTLPVGTAKGDVVYAIYSQGSSNDETMSTVTAGYTKLADLFASDSNDTNLGLFRKVQEDPPDSTVVFAGTASGAPLAGAAMVLSGVDTNTPEDAAVTTATGVNDGGPNPPSITTATDGAWVLACGGSGQDNPAAPTVQAGYSNFVSAVTNDGSFNDAHAMMSRKLMSVAGAEDPGVFGGISGRVADSWCAVTIAVRPAIGGGFPFRPDLFLPLLVR